MSNISSNQSIRTSVTTAEGYLWVDAIGKI